MGVKTDNRSLPTKVYLRTSIVREFDLQPTRVLDLCAGEGQIWSACRKHIEVASYTPCDRTPRMPGTVKGEAIRLVDAFNLDRFNVIDIDTYGEPWPIWAKVTPRINQPTLVLLTYGRIGLCGASRDSMKTAGIPGKWFSHLPMSGKKISEYVGDYCLRHSAQQCKITKAYRVEINTGSSAVTYYGLMCDKR